jgi:hypothetical protein
LREFRDNASAGTISSRKYRITGLPERFIIIGSLLPLKANAMIERLSESSGKNIGFRLAGRLSEADYLKILSPEIENGIREYKSINVLILMENFEGWTVGGAWEDFMLGPKFRDVKKLAIVVDETWDEWMTWLFRVFTALTGTKVRFFRKERLSEAWDWLKSGEQ